MYHDYNNKHTFKTYCEKKNVNYHIYNVYIDEMQKWAYIF